MPLSKIVDVNAFPMTYGQWLWNQIHLIFPLLIMIGDNVLLTECSILLLGYLKGYNSNLNYIALIKALPIILPVLKMQYGVQWITDVVHEILICILVCIRPLPLLYHGYEMIMMGPTNALELLAFMPYNILILSAIVYNIRTAYIAVERLL